MKFDSFIKKLTSEKTSARLAVLIDPDKFNPSLVKLATTLNVSCFLVGGSRLHNGNIHKTVRQIKKLSALPVILFPGDENQLTPAADGLFLPVLVSGRNPEYLIAKQVLMAPKIKRMKLNCLPMAYMLIGTANRSSTQKVTATKPLEKKQEICDTAIAAAYLGYKLIYLEAGSGAQTVVNGAIIRAVKKIVDLPLITGGGIDSVEKARQAIKAGANLVVLGNALEKNMSLLSEISPCFNNKS